MIGYPITPKALRAQIKAHDSKWLTKAAAETKKLKHGQKVDKSMWSDVKPVYMKLQHGKCAFCETLLGKQIDFDLIKQDVEHFRPKNGVDPWPTEKLRNKLKLPTDLPQSTHTAKGYTFLAYHELNYASSCKTCNSTLKSNYFPTIKKPVTAGKNPVTLTKSEQPYLIYPIGDFDVVPEKTITFLGLLPVPANGATQQPDHDRARVTIAFFGLSIRDDLMYGRALLLDQVGDKFKLLAATNVPTEQADLNKEIDILCSPATPYSSCLNAFVLLWRNKPDKAREMLKIVKAYLAGFGEK
ncbi:MAG: hypothetical protein ACKVY0_05030 [Prosthecobacter sp.]|uniref:hypothetical protein n=1 Tax=Prosthecobacter sp. TaxID=1965333 RepID=UPI0039017EC6